MLADRVEEMRIFRQCRQHAARAGRQALAFLPVDLEEGARDGIRPLAIALGGAGRRLDAGEVMLDQRPHEGIFFGEMVKQSAFRDAGPPGDGLERQPPRAQFLGDGDGRGDDALARIFFRYRKLTLFWHVLSLGNGRRHVGRGHFRMI